MAETKEYVRIKKAPCRSIWYADKIGSIFPSLGTWENAYKVDSPDRALYIRKEDAELIVTEKRPAPYELNDSIAALKLGVPEHLYHHVWCLIYEIEALQEEATR
ncbi:MULTISPECIES: hypothetical protein [Bacillus]|uniref:hypothetical protein n=1 Tax=Bacillus TaxID=1386 RepID=UPI0006AEE9FF|nr:MULTISPECIES: hypothetical protein [Bacillus]AWD87910.1 hypothetical protein BVQ_10750 [Bacillus velezensis]KAF6690714.1 hypothetical protein G9362_16870 [Bacillus sp. EKM601B]KOS49234.1 hypothetical protein AN272_19520 [Bacillus amyloliquefaciens]MBA9149703.1 hypothetical protein [Bacillus sp. EKM213B]MBT9285819.1 hypothetical protein [Bacillus velezensis]